METMMSCFTNAILTVIAVALVALVVENAIPLAHAQQPIIGKVVICDAMDSSKCASLRSFSSPSGYSIYYSLITTPAK
jgi:hypothetical protein